VAGVLFCGLPGLLPGGLCYCWGNWRLIVAGNAALFGTGSRLQINRHDKSGNTGARVGLHVWLLGLVAGVGGLPVDRQHLGEVTDRDKNCAVQAHARATPPLWHLLCNPDSIFVILGYLYGLPANPLGGE